MKNIFLYFAIFIILFVLQSCSSSEKSSYPTSESMESTESATNQNEEEIKKDELGKEQAEDVNPTLESKPLQQIIVPEQEFTIEKIIKVKDERSNNNVSGESSSENEQLSISNKNAKVLLFSKKLQKGSYPIAKNSLPYASVHVTLTQGQEKIEGNLEDGIVKLIVLDSAGITKGSFEGTLIKNNERYFIGGNFSN